MSQISHCTVCHQITPLSCTKLPVRLGFCLQEPFRWRFLHGLAILLPEFLLILLISLRSTSNSPIQLFSSSTTRSFTSKNSPSQPHQALAGYNYLLSTKSINASRICLSGDSAGGTIILSILLRLALLSENETDTCAEKGPGSLDEQLFIKSRYL